MPVTGFQDYARLNTQVGQPLASIAQPASPNPATAAIDTTGYAFLTVSINLIGSNLGELVQLGWYLDRALTQQVVTQSFSPAIGGQMAKQFPVLARWCQVTFLNYQGTVTQNIFAGIFGSTVYAPNLRTQQGENPFIYGTASVAAGGTLITTATTTYEGPAMWAVDQALNNLWYSELKYYDVVNNVWNTFARMRGANFGQSAISNVMLPPAQIRQHLNNQHTVAETMFGSVVT